MKSTINATPLQTLRHQKGWRLIQVHEKLKDAGTPVSWPTLLKIDHGYVKKIIRKDGVIIKEKRLPYKPNPRILSDIGKLFHVKAKDMYKDRSKD